MDKLLFYLPLNLNWISIARVTRDILWIIRVVFQVIISLCSFQIGDVLRALGQNPTEADINRFLGNYDKDARLSFEDFVPIFQQVAKNRFDWVIDCAIDGDIKGEAHSGGVRGGIVALRQGGQWDDQCRWAQTSPHYTRYVFFFVWLYTMRHWSWTTSSLLHCFQSTTFLW